MLFMIIPVAVPVFGQEFVTCVPIRLADIGTSKLLVDAPELEGKQFFSDLVLVLNHYKEPNRFDEHGNLMISKKLSKDRELLWNYCNKAQNPNFLRRIKSETANSE